jgi:gluconolactonase
LPERASNLTFGGPERKVLYITATTSLYSVRTSVSG